MSKIDKAREMLIPILDGVGDKNIIDPNKIDVSDNWIVQR